MQNGFDGTTYKRWPSARNIAIYMGFKEGRRNCDLSREYGISSTQIHHICLNIENRIRSNSELRELIESGKQPPVPKYKFSIRTYGVLMRNGFIDPTTGIDLAKLSALSEAEVLRFQDCGRKTLNEIKEVLSEEGMSLSSGTSRIPSAWPLDRDVYIYRMRELGYTFVEIASVFAMTAANAGRIHLNVKEMMDESPLFANYVEKLGKAAS